MLTIRSSQVQQMATSSPGQKIVEPCKGTWVEVRLVDEDGEPVADAEYRIELPDGSVMTGRLDQDGKARFDSIVPGTCKVSFVEIDGGDWSAA